MFNYAVAHNGIYVDITESYEEAYEILQHYLSTYGGAGWIKTLTENECVSEKEEC